MGNACNVESKVPIYLNLNPCIVSQMFITRRNTNMTLTDNIFPFYNLSTYSAKFHTKTLANMHTINCASLRITFALSSIT